MDGVPESPERLIGEHGPWAYRLALRVTQRAELAEEACARALHTAWEKRKRFDGRSSFKTWMYRIALNAAVDALRRERAQTGASVPLGERDLPAPEADPESASERAGEAARVRRALSRLTEAHRTILALREWEGLSYQELAQALDCPIGTVMSRLSLARRALKESLEEDHDDA